MDRGDRIVRGTDTSARTSCIAARTTAPLERYLSSVRDGNVDPNVALAVSLSTTQRRKAGAFFTCAELADTLVAPYARELSGDAVVSDPACGAGDLLLAAARQFKHSTDPDRRLEEWQRRLRGGDVFEAFVLSARLRLSRAAYPEAPLTLDPHGVFRGIARGCSLKSRAPFEGASHVFLNPPYTLVRAPDACEWRTGRVSMAALFMERAASTCAAGTRVAAVLPDVLRSGSGYAKWRDMLASFLDIERTESIGTFARWADVDVFLLHGKVRRRRADNSGTWRAMPVASQTLGTRCSIRVGPVVDYRSPHKGMWCPYLTVKNAPPWERLGVEQLGHRRFAGRLLRPPFVVVRRTSRCGDMHRMVPTVITGTHPVAVENHLLVLIPNANTVAACEDIVMRLRDERTTRWLDQRIRCRHLTVGVVHELPWWDRVSL